MEMVRIVSDDGVAHNLRIVTPGGESVPGVSSVHIDPIVAGHNTLITATVKLRAKLDVVASAAGCLAEPERNDEDAPAPVAADESESAARSIWKYMFPRAARSATFKMPKGATFLSAQAQQGNWVAWFLVDPNAPLCDRTFRAHLTGVNFMYSEDVFLATVQFNGGDFVLHLFEEVSPK